MGQQSLPLRYLWLLPCIAGVTWFSTLFIMLVYWLTQGRPRYLGQTNPYIAFISDIGAFQLQPVFIIGSCITACTFFGTAVGIYYARCSPLMYGLSDAPYRKILSKISLCASLIASISLVALTIFDTVEWHTVHGPLLMVCFLALGIYGVCTLVVYGDQIFGPPDFPRLRIYCILNLGIWVIDFCIGVTFVTFLWMGYFRIAGFLEWTVTFVGAFYILTFIGFVSVPEKNQKVIGDGEDRPLLQST